MRITNRQPHETMEVYRNRQVAYRQRVKTRAEKERAERRESEEKRLVAALEIVVTKGNTSFQTSGNGGPSEKKTK